MLQVYAINRATEDQEKNIAYAVEYEKEVDRGSLSIESFSVSDRQITAVYTNDRPYINEDGCGKPGKYVIVEMDYSSRDCLTLAKRMGKSKPTSFRNTASARKSRLPSPTALSRTPGTGTPCPARI